MDRSKERSKDRRMRMKSDKRPSRKHDRKVLMAEESTKSWADTDSDSSSSSSSSSDSEQEEVHCLMADQMVDVRPESVKFDDVMLYVGIEVADVSFAAGSLARIVLCFGSWRQQRLHGFQQESAIGFRNGDMPRRRRGRGRGQFQESGGQNKDQYSAPSHTRESSEEGEAEAPPAPVDRMDVVIARFQRMSPPIFNGDESSEELILLGNRGGSGSRLPARQQKNKNLAGRRSIQ
ncbi:hypothetical protein F511_15416 [Dorcoceras hygrometricum]|uniref:Uncharacterized protein n=1 Tax=Dorcoceras hygrometricum TaxID=472368 RepID=A0A2Z7ACQ6_9LAMI|nr:hypothetical protein F511_15416 [Dorcoceras hygrometricum]